jgi:glycosyltransferase involved in cell wall biosynthesis
MATADVALITPYPRVGTRHGGMSGVASYAHNLAHALSDSGARVEVVAPLEPGERPRRETDAGVGITRAFSRTSTGAATAVRTALRTGAPVVHLQHEFFLYGGPASTPGLACGLRVLRRRRRRAVATLHQVVDPAGVDRGFTDLHRVRIPAWLARPGLTAVQRGLQRSADRVLVHEPAFAEVLPGATTVPHGIEPARAPEDRGVARAALGLDANRMTVLCFGFLAPYKGLETALEAAEIAGDDVELIIAGGEHPRLAAGGDHYDRDLRERFGHVARFTGRVPDREVARWFTAADVAAFMYPRPFSSSGALALAVAHGTPVLVSPELARTAALPPMMVAERNPQALSRRWRELAADPRQRDELRRETERIAHARTWPAIADRHLELYEEVRRERGAAGR